MAEPERQPKKKKPERPRSPPRFELVLFYALGDTLISEGLPDTSAPGEWEHFGSRELDFGARIKYRETKSGKAWLSLELGLSQLHYAKQTSTDHSCCISDGIVVAIEQVLRFPILGPQYAWQVDNRASIDISAGPYLLNAAEMDIGAQGAIRLSFYWLEIGPVASYGSKSGLGVGVESGLHVAF